MTWVCIIYQIFKNHFWRKKMTAEDKILKNDEGDLIVFEPDAALLEIDLPVSTGSVIDMSAMNRINSFLPQLPINCAIVGARGSGKSVLLFNFLKDKEGWYGHAFSRNNTFFISPTADIDKTMDELELTHKYTPDTLGALPLVFVKNILAQQRNNALLDDMTGVLVVWDDCTQESGNWEAIEKLSYTGRHSHVHQFYVAHKMSAIPRGARLNTLQWYIYPPLEGSENDRILDMFSNSESRPIFQMAMERCWSKSKKENNFVHIDFAHREWRYRYRSGFTDPLFTDEEAAIAQKKTLDGKANLGIEFLTGRGTGRLVDSYRKLRGGKRTRSRSPSPTEETDGEIPKKKRRKNKEQFN